MTVRIHPTAIVDDAAQLGEGVYIGPFSVVGPNVMIEDSVRIGPYVQIGAENCFAPLQATAPTTDESVVRVGANSTIGSRAAIGYGVELEANVCIGQSVVLAGPLKVGERSQIYELAVIGGPGQFPGRHESSGQIEIGKDVTIREFVLVHKPVLTGVTSIGDGSYLMSRTQVDHDCVLGLNVKTACGVTLGGSVQVGEYAYLGMNAVVHQGLRIGPHTMIGMNSTVIRNVPPFAVIIDRRFTRINRYGLELHQIPAHQIDTIEEIYVAMMKGVAPQKYEASDLLLDAIRKFYRDVSASPTFQPSFTGDSD